MEAEGDSSHAMHFLVRKILDAARGNDPPRPPCATSGSKRRITDGFASPPVLGWASCVSGASGLALVIGLVLLDLFPAFFGLVLVLPALLILKRRITIDHMNVLKSNQQIA